MNVNRIALTHDGWYHTDGVNTVYGFPTAEAALDHAQGEHHAILRTIRQPIRIVPYPIEPEGIGTPEETLDSRPGSTGAPQRYT